MVSRSLIAEILGRLQDSPVIAWLQRVWLWTGWLAFGYFMVLFLVETLTPLGAIAFSLTALAFCTPGWVLLSLLWGGERATRQPELWLWGGVLGITIGIWCAVVEGYLTGMASGFSVLALDLVAMVAWFMLSRRDGISRLRLRIWTFGERALWQVVSLWVLVYFWRGFGSFSTIAPDGTVTYPVAFSVEFLEQVTRQVSLAFGFPPTAMGFAGATLSPQAWIEILPVIGRGWMDPTGSPAGWTMAGTLLIAVGFGGIVVSVLRTFTSNLRSLVLVVFVVFFAGSLHWVYPLIRPDLVVNVATGAGPVATWPVYLLSPLIDRWILVAPQTLLTLSLVFLVIAWLRSLPPPPSWFHLAALGGVTGLAICCDPGLGWIAGLLGVAWVVNLWIGYPNDRTRLGGGGGAYAAALVMVLFVARLSGVSVWPHPEFAVDFAVLRSLPGRMAIIFGPSLFLGFWGWRAARRHRVRPPTGFFVFALSVGLLLVSGVRTGSDPLFGIHAGVVVVFVLLVAGLGWFSAHARIEGRTGLLLLGGLLLSLPTVTTDYYFAGAVEHDGHQVRIHPEDRRAAEWVKMYLPQSVVTQSMPVYCLSDSVKTVKIPGLAWGSHLAHRPMAVGPRNMAGRVSDSVFDDRYRRVIEMFSARQPDSLHARAVALGIDYLYAGPYEISRFPLLYARLSASPQLFESVYESDSAGVFLVYPQVPRRRH